MKTAQKIDVQKEWKVLGFTEDVTTCDCCGRVDLKGTLALENISSGDINHYGIICGSKISKQTKKDIQEKLIQISADSIKKAQSEFYQTQEKRDYDYHMITREPRFNVNQSWEERKVIIDETMEFARKADEVKKKIAKKYSLKDFPAV